VANESGGAISINGDSNYSYSENCIFSDNFAMQGGGI
jgi:hypothetical protein